MNSHTLRPSGALWAAAIIAAPALGLTHLFGILPAAGLAVFLLAVLAMLLQHKLYHLMVLIGIGLLFCVFIEPAPSDILLCAAVPIGLLTGLYRPRFYGRALPAIILFGAYFVACLPGIARAADQADSLQYHLVTLYLFLIALFFCTYATSGNVNSMLRAYLVAAALSFVLGLAGFLGLFPDYLMADDFRIKGLFKDPNVFGPFFVPAILLLVDDMGRRTLVKARAAVHVALISFLSLGVIFSFSRGAWINLLVSIFVFLLLNGKLVNILKPRVLVPAAAGLFLLGWLLFSPLLSKTGIPEFLLDRAQPQSYDTERFDTQRGGLKLALENPLGVGAGQFENEIAKITKFRLSAHSLYIRTAAENGAAGFVLLMASIAYLLACLFFSHKKSLGEKKRQPVPAPPDGKRPPAPVENGASCAFCIAVLCGLLVSGIAVDIIHWRHFWLFTGVGLYNINREE